MLIKRVDLIQRAHRRFAKGKRKYKISHLEFSKPIEQCFSRSTVFISSPMARGDGAKGGK